MKILRTTAALVVIGGLIACSDSGDSSAVDTDAPPVAENPAPAEPEPTVPFQELYDQGVDRYLGVYTPMLSQAADGGAVTHLFGEGDGPLCYTGNPFSMSTRDGTSDALLIFVQGGGICGTQACEAVEDPIPLFDIGLLSAADQNNPAADFNLGYVPYCDGTLFTGDRDLDTNGDGIDDRFFRGVQNLSAALDVIANTYPAPSRILLAGNSAGGFGTHTALPLVRRLYPEVPVDLINDSGTGILEPGDQDGLNEYWNAASNFPASCTDCIGDDGNLTGYHRYQLAEDENVRMGFISSTADEVVLGSSTIDQATFENELREAVAELETAYPDRFRSLINEGEEHTFILRRFDFEIGNTTVREWIT
ncbi:MAG: pectin acetylesterase-family hydrolase, partial [Wenzhouxiangella sp.]|nr:pectin acetylesterase-family hydrolase [Wenzhouxiangella sp.]